MSRLSPTISKSCHLKIRFVVIVQPHLLRDKGSVRLRHVLGDGGGADSSSSGNEQFVAIDNLAWTIRELCPETSNGVDESTEDQPDSLIQNQSSNIRDSSRSLKPSVDCIFVDHDQYFDSDKPVSKADVPNWKALLKTMKGIAQKGESFVSSMADPSTNGAGDFLPIFAVADVSFWVLRDFGTMLMKRANERSTTGACLEIKEQYPKHKRTIKTLGSAIDNFMKSNGFWVTTGSHGNAVPKVVVIILLYSKVDDRFDMVTLESGLSDGASNDHGRHNRRK